MRKLGLIAGGGGLPVTLANHCLDSGRDLFVVRLKGFADLELGEFPGEDVGIAQIGRAVRAMRKAGCQTVCLAGTVRRPDFATIRPDLMTLRLLPGIMAAARQGDDALLSFLLQQLERAGFQVEGAHEVMGELTLPTGPIGRHRPRPQD